MSDLTDKILALSHLRSPHIAEQLGCNARYARRILKKHGLEHRIGPPDGENNPAWRGGRMVDLDGYVLLQTKPTRVLEHRQIVQQVVGRPLTSTEVVDHIDGITIHNAPANLRVFATNGEHLAATTAPPVWSKSGRQNIGRRIDIGRGIQRVDTHRQRKERGDVRLRAILRAALELGTEHPCLSGTRHWLTQNGIDPYSRPNLKRAWDDLLRRFAADLAR